MEPYSFTDLMVIGYADALTDDQTPTSVPAIYQAQDGLCLLPPFKLDGLKITEATLRSEDELHDLNERKLVTLLDIGFRAQPNYLLWVDAKERVRYAQSSEALSYLWGFADAMVVRSIEEFGTNNQKALEYAQRAIVANERCMAAFLLKALIYSQEGQEEDYAFLVKMIKTLGRTIINE